jgi:hypothetical protein
MTDNKSRPTTATDVHVEIKQNNSYGKSMSDFCVNILIQVGIVIFFR